MKPPKDVKTPVEAARQSDMNELERGTNGSMHPEAVAALAQHTAAKQSADEQWIQRVDDGVAALEMDMAAVKVGDTPFQRDLRAAIATNTNQLHMLTVTRVIRPTTRTLAVIFLATVLVELYLRLPAH